MPKSRVAAIVCDQCGQWSDEDATARRCPNCGSRAVHQCVVIDCPKGVPAGAPPDVEAKCKAKTHSWVSGKHVLVS